MTTSAFKIFHLERTLNEKISEVLKLESDLERLIAHAATLGYCIVDGDDGDIANESWRSLPQDLMDKLNAATEKVAEEQNA